MAAANENQGLKIAVAAFVSLTVILAVSSYFLYSNYSQAEAKRIDEAKKAESERQTAAKALDNLQELRDKAGFKGIEDFEQLKAQLNKFQEKVTNDVNDINGKIKKSVAEYAQAAGQDPRIKELADAADQLAAT